MAVVTHVLAPEQANWQRGYLDVDGEQYQRIVDEGYTYSERI